MRVTAEEIAATFEALIKGTRTREAVSTWAAARMEAQDSQALEYAPKDQEALIWRALCYLSGVDLKNSPEAYLHGSADFERERQKLGF